MGIPLGVLSAVYRGTVIDRAAKIVAFLGQSTPSFWLGIMLMLFVGVFLLQQGLPLLPISGRGGPVTYILPAFTMGWFVEAVLALPLILVALSFVFTFGFSFWNVVLILCPFVAARFARIVRGETLSVRERDYVALAKVIGAPTHRIGLKHILPNVFNTVVVISTLEVGHIILVESSLSFLGVGIPPPRPAWGLMVSEGRQFITSAYWISLFPGLAILATVLSLNLFGDWLRDTMDPRRREL